MLKFWASIFVFKFPKLFQLTLLHAKAKLILIPAMMFLRLPNSSVSYDYYWPLDGNLRFAQDACNKKKHIQND